MKPKAIVTETCGVRRNSGTIEWVCVRPIHDKETNKNRGQQITGYHPESERHYFRPMYDRSSNDNNDS